MSDQKNSQTFTTEQMLQLIAAIKAPTEPTEAQKAQQETDATMRRERGQMELNKIAEKNMTQSICSHTRMENGTTRCVHIYGQSNLNDYMICQECNAFIHAEPRPPAGSPLAKDLENHIFDTRLFNLHYRLSQARTTF